MNQIPNIEETHNTREIEEIFREYEWLAESTGNPTMHIGGERLQNLKNDIKAHIHQQLQKARHDWLREEIGKLEGMKMANEHNSECLHNEAPEYCDCDNYIKWNKALQIIIDRYLLELESIAQN